MHSCSRGHGWYRLIHIAFILGSQEICKWIAGPSSELFLDYQCILIDLGKQVMHWVISCSRKIDTFINILITKYYCAMVVWDRQYPSHQLYREWIRNHWPGVDTEHDIIIVIKPVKQNSVQGWSLEFAFTTGERISYCPCKELHCVNSRRWTGSSDLLKSCDDLLIKDWMNCWNSLSDEFNWIRSGWDPLKSWIRYIQLSIVGWSCLKSCRWIASEKLDDIIEKLDELLKSNGCIVTWKAHQMYAFLEISPLRHDIVMEQLDCDCWRPELDAHCSKSWIEFLKILDIVCFTSWYESKSGSRPENQLCVLTVSEMALMGFEIWNINHYISDKIVDKCAVVLIFKHWSMNTSHGPLHPGQRLMMTQGLLVLSCSSVLTDNDIQRDGSGVSA